MAQEYEVIFYDKSDGSEPAKEFLTSLLVGSFNMSNFNDYLKEQLADPEFKSEYDALAPEFSIVQAMIDARKISGLTQKQLAEKTGIAQADISKLESGNANPSIRTLQRLAAGMGMQVKIEFLPIRQEV